jgi:hypothetical protein
MNYEERKTQLRFVITPLNYCLEFYSLPLTYRHSDLCPATIDSYYCFFS